VNEMKKTNIKNFDEAIDTLIETDLKLSDVLFFITRHKKLDRKTKLKILNRIVEIECSIIKLMEEFYVLSESEEYEKD